MIHKIRYNVKAHFVHFCAVSPWVIPTEAERHGCRNANMSMRDLNGTTWRIRTLPIKLP